MFEGFKITVTGVLLAAVIGLVIGLSMQGCQSLGLATPQTLDQRIAYSYAGVTTALNTVTTALQSGQLTSTQATNANSLILNVKSVLDTAKGEETADPTAAEKELALGVAAMTAVQNYLAAAGVK